MHRTLALIVVFGGSLCGCSRDSGLVGTFGGDWNIGGSVMIVQADGGMTTYKNADAAKGVSSQSEVTISKQDGDRYQVKLDTPFMACALNAVINDAKELVFEGPEQLDLYKPDALSKWQHCAFTFEGFRGEANVRGTVRSKPGDSLSIVLQIIPASSPPLRVLEGSAAMANFSGSRARAKK